MPLIGQTGGIFVSSLLSFLETCNVVIQGSENANNGMIVHTDINDEMKMDKNEDRLKMTTVFHQ